MKASGKCLKASSIFCLTDWETNLGGKKDPFTLPAVLPYCPAALGRAPDPPHLDGLVELCPCWEMPLQISVLEGVIRQPVCSVWARN